ncbi:hypothetical protein [Endozoicomonas numazuensis]|uniref:Cytotoxic necrotizing factor Rho-activating domain-containing protein n=1 Tax=Endozoicomonas numazuensis TaxID=1137799 RepID=A0A081NGQ0_9GAMM|nr:hypothetical protein [Endozoicomonas numazuensis]KEQ17623.1 hypothetical protein GZ78_18010 [Endozoicomonas numazuensis]
MAVVKELLENKPLSVNGGSRRPTIKGDHYMYSNDSCSVTYREVRVDGNLTVMVDVRVNQNGDTSFLPWQENKICSLVLPARGGPSVFQTSSMSGCAFYIDKIGNDLIVYHANANKCGGGQGSPLANYQSPNAIKYLDKLHASAGNDYLDNGFPILQRKLQKEEYFKGVQQAGGGAMNLVGYRTNGQWKFYYQAVEGNRVLRCKQFYPQLHD